MISTTLWNKCAYAKCFGHWLVSDAECIRCAVADSCEKRTKRKIDEENNPLEDDDVAAETPSPITPLEYLIQSLSGKLDHDKEERDQAILHRFRKDGKLIIAVAIGTSGRIKVVSLVKNTQKIFGSLGSIDEVETLIGEMI
jgi:hypothetical protein